MHVSCKVPSINSKILSVVTDSYVRSLSRAQWLRAFVAACLQGDATSRPTAHELLEEGYIPPGEDGELASLAANFDAVSLTSLDTIRYLPGIMPGSFGGGGAVVS